MNTRSRARSITAAAPAPMAFHARVPDAICYICLMARDDAPGVDCAVCTAYVHVKCLVDMFLSHGHPVGANGTTWYPNCGVGHPLGGDPLRLKVEASSSRRIVCTRAAGAMLLTNSLQIVAPLILLAAAWFLPMTSGTLVVPAGASLLYSTLAKEDSVHPHALISFLLLARAGAALVAWILPFEMLSLLPRFLLGLGMILGGASINGPRRDPSWQEITGLVLSVLHVWLPVLDPYWLGYQTVLILLCLVGWTGLVLRKIFFPAEKMLVTTIAARNIDVRRPITVTLPQGV